MLIIMYDITATASALYRSVKTTNLTFENIHVIDLRLHLEKPPSEAPIKHGEHGDWQPQQSRQ